jgi:hypothetical protein
MPPALRVVMTHNASLHSSWQEKYRQYCVIEFFRHQMAFSRFAMSKDDNIPNSVERATTKVTGGH